MCLRSDPGKYLPPPLGPGTHVGHDVRIQRYLPKCHACRTPVHGKVLLLSCADGKLEVYRGKGEPTEEAGVTLNAA